MDIPRFMADSNTRATSPKVTDRNRRSSRSSPLGRAYSRMRMRTVIVRAGRFAPGANGSRLDGRSLGQLDSADIAGACRQSGAHPLVDGTGLSVLPRDRASLE